MKIAIMQPYFLPYIGYFQLIKSADIFVLADEYQYTKKGWINRNRAIFNKRVETFTLAVSSEGDCISEKKLYSWEDRKSLFRKIKQSYIDAPNSQNINVRLEEFIVSEEGIKTYIVKKIINILNSRLNYYLQTFDAPCKCVFDEMFEETIYNDQGKECSYFNFSGGERKRIDTAILFTFQDVMRCHSGTSFSLNIYDELFDCALDAKGTDKILEVLKEKVAKYDESIYIVSHKSSEVANCDNVIHLLKYNGVTRIVS
jgi:ABC-type dipeptide/oligopeptide/nickel transport system ATPase subunit